MGFVDPQALWPLGPLVLERVPLRGGGVPEPSVVGGRDGEILGDILDPGR